VYPSVKVLIMIYGVNNSAVFFEEIGVQDRQMGRDFHQREVDGRRAHTTMGGWAAKASTLYFT